MNAANGGEKNRGIGNPAAASLKFVEHEEGEALVWPFFFFIYLVSLARALRARRRNWIDAGKPYSGR